MDYKNRLEQINLQNAIRGQIKTNLQDILQSLTRERLYSLASFYNLPGRSKMNKQSLAAGLFNHVADAQNLESCLLIAETEEWDIFVDLSNRPFLQCNTIPFGTYVYLLDSGLIYSFFFENRLYLIMPDEIKQIYNKVDMESFQKKRDRYQRVMEYILAMVNLYGAFKPEKLIEIFNSQNDIKLEQDEFIAIYRAFTARPQYFCIHKGYVIDSYLEHNAMDKFGELLQKTEGKPYYIPGRDELLRYADDLYFEMTPQLAALKDYILKSVCSDEDVGDDLIDEIQLHCSMEAPLQDIFFEFEIRDIVFNDTAQVKKMVPLIIDVYNNTRLWSNRAHTPEEMASLSGKTATRSFDMPFRAMVGQQARSEKVGRNEPCPCGSGKKYKKCCGK